MSKSRSLLITPEDILSGNLSSNYKPIKSESQRSIHELIFFGRKRVICSSMPCQNESIFKKLEEIELNQEVNSEKQSVKESGVSIPETEEPEPFKGKIVKESNGGARVIPIFPKTAQKSPPKNRTALDISDYVSEVKKFDNLKKERKASRFNPIVRLSPKYEKINMQLEEMEKNERNEEEEETQTPVRGSRRRGRGRRGRARAGNYSSNHKRGRGRQGRRYSDERSKRIGKGIINGKIRILKKS